MNLGLVVYDTGENLSAIPRIFVEVIPCKRFRWYVEVHVHFEETTDHYHYQDLDKHFYSLRKAIRYGIDIGDDLSYFFWSKLRQDPNITPEEFARITDLPNILKNSYEESLNGQN